MKKTMLSKLMNTSMLVITLGAPFAGMAAAEGEESANLFAMKEQAPIIESQVKILANLDVAFSALSGANSKVTLGAGTDVDWFFTPNVGAFVGLDYNPIRSKRSGADLEVTYLDIPFGAAFNFGSGSSIALGAMNGNFNAIMNVGLYAGMPLSKFKIAGTDIDSANTIIGLNVEGHGIYKFSQTFGLGFHAGLKYGFNEVVDNVGDDYKPFVISAGLGLQFL